MVELVFDKGQAAVVKIGDNIASEIVNDLKFAFEEAIAKGCINIDVDMTGVGYINSSGLSIIVGTHSKLKAKQGGVKLSCVSQALFDFFENINLTKVLPIAMRETD